MTDKELIRRALTGDQEAQKKCTEKGIVLPCPFCKGEAIVEYDAIVPFEYDVVCGDCGVMRGISEDKKIALKEWNTRPAPPIGRCKDCENWYKGHCASGTFTLEETDAEFFCGNYNPKEE